MAAQVSKVFNPESQEVSGTTTEEAITDDEVVDEGTNAALDAVVGADGVDENTNVTITAVAQAASIDEKTNAQITAPHLKTAKGGPRDSD